MTDEDEHDNGSAAQLPSSDTLDAPAGTVDEDGGVATPPDRPVVSDQDDMTARGMHEGETLDDRLSREEPEIVEETGPTIAVADRAADAEVDRAREDDAARIDALRDAAGAAAPASGRTDAGDVTGL